LVAAASIARSAFCTATVARAHDNHRAEPLWNILLRFWRRFGCHRFLR
jgi:hypothetical protein